MAADPQADAKQNELRGTLPSGTRLRNYELVSVLGQGGFGITYYARDATLGREVAIKEYLPTSLALREDGTMVVPRSTQLAEDFVWGRERFLEEARILATLEAVPSIVRVYDFLEANGTAYMVMALARGDTLEQRLKQNGKLPSSIAERLLGRLLDGLEEIHKAGFLHRDVKPANVILDAKNNPTLIDFGASRAAMADRTAAMTAIFTPRYAAAEQLTSDKQGPWTDIYGVSATLYHAITGHAPPSSLERALNDAYEPLTKLSPPGFSSDVLRGIDTGLAVRSKDRPQSIALWRDMLFPTEASAGDLTVVAARPKPARAAGTATPPVPPSTRSGSTPTTAGAPAGRKRIALYGGVAAAAFVLAVGGYLALAPKSVPPPAQHQEATADRRDAAANAQAEDEARQKAEAEAQQKAAEAQQKAAAEAEAQQKAAAEAQQKAAAEAQQKAAAEAQQKAAAEAQQKAAAEAQQKAAAEAQQKAAAEAQQKAAAEAQQKGATEAQQKAEDDARRKADAEAWLKKEAEAMKKAEAEARQKAEADAAAQKSAEATEAALGLTSSDRQRIQVALTSLGFDTRGFDGVFGPRSRDMISGWQKARNQPATGFVTAAQQQALLKEAAPALAKYDQEQKKAEEARRREDASARARTAASPSSYGGVSCQDTSGRRIDFPNAASCPYGLIPLR
ncbi:protein kinase domain-containing protein [Reyranella sp.]|uniref:protein kinase domain-containing protein n=1 Tax=Reyranella sp. TaxID=1929291 RepID=UPI002F9363E2